jgi:hypothetical protein
MKSIFLFMMVAFGIVAITTPAVTFNNESLMINHEGMLAALFYGSGLAAMISSILFSISKG